LYAAEEDQETIRFDVEFNTDIYQKQTIKKWLSYYIHIFHHVIEHQNIHLGDIHVLDEHETSSFIHTFNQTKQDYPKHETNSRLFEYQAAKTPHAPAVIYDRQTWTYRELNERANRIAAALRANGVGSEGVIALLTSRTPELAVGILGILKAGGAYLPIDPDYPEDRVKYMLEDSGADMVVIQEPFKSKIDGRQLITAEDTRSFSKENLPNVNKASDLAYVIYTSGSSGRPKGVMTTHRNVVHYVDAFTKRIPLSEHDTVLQVVSFSFDAFSEEVYPILACSGRLVISRKVSDLNI
ncbi:AMP-binding protein, partial [Bacillus licheniformis]|uniref:AMP-binding protein n=1 Tax=Bacillus licheniformis TaxID=1402 RepID=UPI00237CB6F3